MMTHPTGTRDGDAGGSLHRIGSLIRRGGKRLLTRWTGPRTVFPARLTVRLPGMDVDFDTRSEIAQSWFFPRYQDGRPHEEPVTNLLCSRLETTSVFFDVGANVGYYSAVAARVCTGGEVHSFEVDPQLVSEIRRNLSLNAQVPGNVTCAAVWDRDGAVLGFAPHMPGNKSTNRVETSSARAGLHVASITLDTYCMDRGVQPDVVKIDVEGAELHVLQGMDHVMAGVRTLLLEVHPMQLQDGPGALADIQAILERHGFRAARIADHRHASGVDLEPVEDIAKITRNSMLLCERSG